MFRLTPTVLAALLVMCLAFAKGASTASPDLSTPKKAALAFARAIEAGDVAGAEAASTGSAEDVRILHLIANMVSAARQLRDAGVARFGEAGKTIVSCDSMANLSQQIETADEHITGDTATVLHRYEVDPMKLRRNADGQWKVDLASMSDKDTKSRVIPRVQKVLSAGAADIRAGKYRTAADANDAIGQQMFAIISEPTTRPARSDALK
ncbi:MAG TPA: hypothetical protein VGI81_09830 [Tepidisphaeraceae bacterium]|jgi:hypothetical protein